MIKRELYMSRIRPFIGTELIKVMTGIRRCGKSVMLELIKQELTESGVSPTQFISINFEDMSYSHLQTAQALHDEITARAAEIEGKVYLFFDEIQEVKDWEKCINSLRVSLDCDIYITGSNAKLLSGELATYLGGRYVEFVIYPFSFGEFMELYRSIAPDASIQQCFQKYLLAGGMPYLANLRYADAPSKQYLHDLFNSVQLKDIVKRNKIRDVDLLERIIAYVIANVGTTFSATSLAKFLKNEQRTVAPETILNYIKYCCEAYLFYQVKREDLQGKQILASNEKYYIADHGIREAVFGGNMRDINLILENIVYLELLRALQRQFFLMQLVCDHKILKIQHRHAVAERADAEARNQLRRMESSKIKAPKRCIIRFKPLFPAAVCPNAAARAAPEGLVVCVTLPPEPPFSFVLSR